MTVLCLSAQTPSKVTPSAQGVSNTFQSYSRLNPAVPGANDGQDVEVPNQLYIPRGTHNPNAVGRIGPATISTLPSTMYNQTTGGTLPVTVGSNYFGLGNGFNGWTNQGLLPSDTTLAVGNNQILQWVNLRLTILNKALGTPLLPGSGYVQANQVWSGLPATSICRTQNNGDPTVQYDRLANRWLLHQFAFNSTNTQNAMCFAVSQSNDATLGYYLYEIGRAHV